MRTACTNSPTFQPDLILLDWQLPGATGLEVLTTLKQSRQWASIPVIMFTGMRSPIQVESARQSGACDVLEKPMQIDEWLEIPAHIENVLASAETHAIH